MKRTTLSLVVVVAVVAALVGISALSSPRTSPAAQPGGKPEYVPVQHADAVCPQPADSSDTVNYTAFAPGPVSDGTVARGRTAVQALGSKETYPGPKKPGRPTTFHAKPSAAPLVASAEDDLAPGFTMQQTAVATSGAARGMSGLSCPEPGTSFWFPSAASGSARDDTVELVNTGSERATVDIALRDKQGAVHAKDGKGISVDAGDTTTVRLESLVSKKTKDLSVHVIARSGRVAAALRASESKHGSDWIPPASRPQSEQVVPGLPEDATDAYLTLVNPGREDTSVALRVSGKNGPHTPAKHSTVEVPAGAARGVDLGDLSHGEASALRLTPAPGAARTPVVAGVRVTREKKDKKDVAYLSAAAPVGTRASLAENRQHKGETTLHLTAASKAAKVRVTSSSPVAGGKPASTVVSLKAGSTVAVEPPRSSKKRASGKKGQFGVSVETLSGGPVHASRMLSHTKDGVPMFTLQPLSDDHGQVLRPAAREDVSVLLGDE